MWGGCGGRRCEVHSELITVNHVEQFEEHEKSRRGESSERVKSLYDSYQIHPVVLHVPSVSLQMGWIADDPA